MGGGGGESRGAEREGNAGDDTGDAGRRAHVTYLLSGIVTRPGLSSA